MAAPKKATPKQGIGSGSGTQAARTPSGGVSAAARAKTGSGKDKAFPLPDKQAAGDAIRLRNNGNSMSSDQVLDKVARSDFGKDPEIAAKLKAARAQDRKK